MVLKLLYFFVCFSFSLKKMSRDPRLGPLLHKINYLSSSQSVDCKGWMIKLALLYMFQNLYSWRFPNWDVCCSWMKSAGMGEQVFYTNPIEGIHLKYKNRIAQCMQRMWAQKDLKQNACGSKEQKFISLWLKEHVWGILKELSGKGPVVQKWSRLTPD